MYKNESINVLLTQGDKCGGVGGVTFYILYLFAICAYLPKVIFQYSTRSYSTYSTTREKPMQEGSVFKQLSHNTRGGVHKIYSTTTPPTPPLR
jgi:hypothetical protein